MSRLRHYFRSIASGYLLMAVNILFTFGSIALALRYMSKAEFGLWALASQFAFYLNLLDLGMSGAATRILMDYKDDRGQTHYGGVIQTSLLVNFSHAAIILAVGVPGSFLLGPLLKIPVDLVPIFRLLMLWQCAITAFNSCVRTPGAMLAAHHRLDVFNLSQTGLFLLSFGVLWLGLVRGAGVFSFVWGQAAGSVLAAAVSFGACARLGLFPAAGRWGRPGMRWFGELFQFGRDMFLYSVGTLLINFSQTFLVTRVAGLDAAAVWSVCTRAFITANQLTSRFFDFSIPAFGEMLVRGEKAVLFSRFKSVLVLSATVSVVAGGAFAAGNQAFTALWTGNRMGWPALNDWLLAVWLVQLVLVRAHTGLVGLTKDFRFLRYILFCEGLFFILFGFLALRWQGIPAMLVVSIVGTLLMSLPYGIWRNARFFGLPWTTVAFAWTWPSLRVAAVLFPLAGLASWLTMPLLPLPRLLISSGFTVVLGGILALRWGLDEGMQLEIARRLPARLEGLRRWVQPQRAERTPAGRGADGPAAGS